MPWPRGVFVCVLGCYKTPVTQPLLLLARRPALSRAEQTPKAVLKRQEGEGDGTAQDEERNRRPNSPVEPRIVFGSSVQRLLSIWKSTDPKMLRAPSSLVALLLALALLGHPGQSAESADPPPCKENRECFNYTVVCRGDGYEGRRYPASSWVGTRVDDGSQYFNAIFKSFWRLFRYIQMGQNERKANIPMTSPVLTRVQEAEGAFEVYFMVPEAFRADPPKPTEETVFLTTFPELEVYARFFGGWMTDDVRLKQLQALDQALGRDQRAVRAGVHYTAGFNSPFEFSNRRNEVWRLAEGALACPPAPEESPGLEE